MREETVTRFRLSLLCAHSVTVFRRHTLPANMKETPCLVFWCTADPGWVTGTSYGIIAPLTHGVSSIIDEADFDAERWCLFPSRPSAS
jgi:acyl-coenzyme A synthetase/AMP-(fatty) acid ligase